MATDQEELQAFINRVQQIVGALITQPHDLIRPEMRPYFLDAWEEVSLQIPSIHMAVGALSDGALRVLGLSGAQLRLKLEGFRRADDAVPAFGWTRDVIKKVLKWINILLGSILAGVPGAEPLKELKESLEAEIDD